MITKPEPSIRAHTHTFSENPFADICADISICSEQ